MYSKPWGVNLVLNYFADEDMIENMCENERIIRTWSCTATTQNKASRLNHGRHRSWSGLKPRNLKEECK